MSHFFCPAVGLSAPVAPLLMIAAHWGLHSPIQPGLTADWGLSGGNGCKLTPNLAACRQVQQAENLTDDDAVTAHQFAAIEAG